jgi:YD repeat-containing protein
MLFLCAMLAFAGLALWPVVYERLPATVSDADLHKALTPPTMDGTHPCVFAILAQGKMETSLGSCATPVTHADSLDRFEVDLRSASFVLRQTDLRLDDDFSPPLTRSYNSRDYVSATRTNAFGRDANHPYDIAIVGENERFSNLLLILEDGDILGFKRISKGTSYSNAVFLHTETSTPYYGATIAWDGFGWTLTMRDGSKTHFPESYDDQSMARGAPTRMADGNGEKLSLVRDSSANLQQVMTPHGRALHFDYDSSNRITRASDDRGSSVTYAYNNDGMLISVTKSKGTKRLYEYQGSLMTAVRDEHGQVLVRNTYDGTALASQSALCKRRRISLPLPLEPSENQRGDGRCTAAQPNHSLDSSRRFRVAVLGVCRG